MMRRQQGLAVLTLALVGALAACGSPPDGPPSESASATDDTPAVAAAAPTDGPPAVFLQCKACHAVEAGKNGVGPSLAGIVGRRAGTVPGFAYSDANKASGVTWDEATLDAYLTAPLKFMPGTKMSYAGLADASKRKELIEYLKELK